MTALTRKEESWGSLGPAMKALPNDRYRAFVDFYLMEKPGYGAQTNAAKRAGFGKPETNDQTYRAIAWRIMQDPRVVAALAEEARKMLRGGAPDAVKALQGMVDDPTHKDHARAVAMVLDRTDPTVSNQHIAVTHRIVDPIQEEIEELRALRHLGTSREKLLEIYGGNGLDRLEALEAEDAATKARVVNAKVVEQEPNGISEKD